MAWIDPVVSKKTGKVTGYKIRYRVNGKKPSSETYRTKAEAAQNLDRYEAIEKSLQPLMGTREHASLTLMEIIERYLDDKIKRKELLKEYRAERKRDLLRVVKQGGWRFTTDVTPSSIVAWRQGISGEGRTSAAYLRGMLKWSNENLNQAIHPLAHVRLRPSKRAQREPERPAAEDVLSWLQKARDCGANTYALVVCILWQGWRPKMCRAMRVGHFNVEGGFATLGEIKGQPGSTKKTFLFPVVIEALRTITAYRPRTDYLFQDPRTGRGWAENEKDRCNITHWWRRHIDGRKGRGVYQLKSDAISYLSEFLSPAQIQGFTLQADKSTVLIYDRTNEQQQKKSIDLVVQKGARWGQDVQRSAISPEPDSHKPLEKHDAQSGAMG